MLALGQIEIRRVEELSLELWSSLLPDWRKEAAGEQPSWLLPNFYVPAKDLFPVSIHSWLLLTPTHRILIDTCTGNQKHRPTYKLLDRLDTPWLERLAGCGVRREDIDFVVCTHFHVDHVGWNTYKSGDRWLPTFPNATYILSRIEREARDPAFGKAQVGSPDHQIFLDSILPLIESGQARWVEGHESIAPGVDLIPAPGHAPGQVAVRVRSLEREALFVGDVMHHPLQIVHPDWNTNLCEDPAQARLTRRRILEHCATHRSVLAPAHFARPHCGHVVRTKAGYDFVPLEQMA